MRGTVGTAQAKAMQRAKLTGATAYAQELANGGHGLTEIAAKLTAQGFTTSTGKRFAQPVQVKRLLERAKSEQM